MGLKLEIVVLVVMVLCSDLSVGERRFNKYRRLRQKDREYVNRALSRQRDPINYYLGTRVSTHFTIWDIYPKSVDNDGSMFVSTVNSKSRSLERSFKNNNNLKEAVKTAFTKIADEANEVKTRLSEDLKKIEDDGRKVYAHITHEMKTTQQSFLGTLDVNSTCHETDVDNVYNTYFDYFHKIQNCVNEVTIDPYQITVDWSFLLERLADQLTRNFEKSDFAGVEDDQVISKVNKFSEVVVEKLKAFDADSATRTITLYENVMKCTNDVVEEYKTQTPKPVTC